tara:strand:- start:43 stop:1584 length:1542 start_codon:yes stop_codon:yes gene_type:complete
MTHLQGQGGGSVAGPSDDKISFPGDSVLKTIDILRHSGEPWAMGIKAMVDELNIYESIYQTAITGSVVITDARNLPRELPLQGTERLQFKLYTPGAHRTSHGTIDATQETGHPFHIYKLGNRRQLKEGMLNYTLYFCSREMLRSLRTKVSQAYTGPLHQSAANIFTDQLYLDSRKKLYVEPTRNNQTIVIPNLRPLNAISLLAQKSLSGNTNGGGYFFYETTKGYYFRSWESMIASQGKYPRQAVQNFNYRLRNVKDRGLKLSMQERMSGVMEYEFIQNYDSATQQAIGTYGHTVITHNIYDKSYDEHKFNYHARYNDFIHVADTGLSDHLKQPIADIPVDWDAEKNVSDYSDSKISLYGTTQYLHNKETGVNGIDVKSDGETYAVKTMQRNSVVRGITVQLTVHGQSFLEAGDIINFNLRTVEPKGHSPVESDDPHLSGRYVITAIRHRWTDIDYRMILTCVRDSVNTSYGTHNDKQWPGIASASSGQVINLYDTDTAYHPTSGQIHMAGDR